MNTLFVVATGDALSPESLASMDAAKARWGCTLSLISASHSTLHPACWKLLAFDESPCDRAMILDADTVVNSKCPNPFEEFPEDKLTVVTDLQTHQPHRDKHEAAEWAIVTGFKTRPDRYFNTGMMLASRAHQLLFEEAFMLCEKFPSLVWHDQTPLNAVMWGSDLLNYTDDSWNFHNPNLRLPNWRQMEKNIYHFPGNPDRARLISEVQWK